MPVQAAAQLIDGLDGLPLDRNPNVVDARAASTPLYGAFRTVIVEPLTDWIPFHTWVTAWPLASVHCAVQPVIGALPAVTVTSPWKPPGHALIVV